jgi:hypothetical protein
MVTCSTTRNYCVRVPAVSWTPVHLFQVAEHTPSVALRVANFYLRDNELNVHAGNGNNGNDSEFVDVSVPACPPFF